MRIYFQNSRQHRRKISSFVLQNGLGSFKILMDCKYISQILEAATTASALLEMKEREKGRGSTSYAGWCKSLRDQWFMLKKENAITEE
eukprot:11383268-Ditylum_brightwellii.AAC.1